MRALERQQMQEEQALLTPTNEGISNSQQVALSAPTTPPRGVSALTNGDGHLSNGGASGLSFLHHQVVTNGMPEEYKRHSANYGSLAHHLSESPTSLVPGSHNHSAGAKSMPGSRRGSSGSSDAGDMVASLNLGSLSIRDPQPPRLNGSAHPLRSATNPEILKANAASLFDEDLDNEMTSKCTCFFHAVKFPIVDPPVASLRQLPTQTEDERINVRANYTRKVNNFINRSCLNNI